MYGGPLKGRRPAADPLRRGSQPRAPFDGEEPPKIHANRDNSAPPRAPGGTHSRLYRQAEGRSRGHILICVATQAGLRLHARAQRLFRKLKKRPLPPPPGRVWCKAAPASVWKAVTGGTGETALTRNEKESSL